MFKAVNISANVLKYIVGIAGVILSVLIVVKWDEKVKNVGDIIGYLDGTMKLVWITIAVCAAIAILFGIAQFFMNIGKNKGGLIGLIGFAGIIILSFFVFSKSKLAEYISGRGEQYALKIEEKGGIDAFWLNISESGLYAVYILLALAVLVAVVAEVSKLLK